MRLLLPLVAAGVLLTSCAEDPPPDALPLGIPSWSDTVYVTPRPWASPQDNPLYATPRVTVSCPLSRTRDSTWASIKKYLNAVSACLDRTWKAEFDRVGMSFWAPNRTFVRDPRVDPLCGLMPHDGASGTYCTDGGLFYVDVGRLADDPGNIAFMTTVVAHEYGHHIQRLSQIDRFPDPVTAGTPGVEGADLSSRRFELQAECLAGVALNAMKDDLPPWQRFRENYGGTLAKQSILDHGRLATQLRWLEKGFRSGKPGVCDTWSAKAGDVT
ncbi:hypothetical protein GCM10009530_55580 [Microbispora corallina]|uniref:Metalloprotease n=1 Tax=Microbispora corallina TaxID=83302 RepID=A0ABQ4G710_9ACTN|nr:neutral zinc metallopeptidase [Microbispora corallina]GIH42839.1 hypothetical protein Mco01_58390 [Microbispora corallina]